VDPIAALRDAVERAALRLELAQRRLLVAVSGGIDSVALAHALRAISQRCGLELAIGHVNHGLRGAESDADQALVEALAAQLGLRALVERVAPGALRAGGPSRDRPTLQEAARELRYAALRRMADAAGAQHVVTAHTLDDQAETVLLRILRGTGPDGLGAIPERSPDGRIVRPLLAVSRAEIERFAAARGLVWREDASNASPAYARNRLRSDWLPGLARSFNPRLLRALADLAEAQRRDSEWIEAQVEREAGERLAIEDGWLRIEATGWRDLPEALSRRVARRALVACGAARLVSRRHLERMDAFLRHGLPGRAIELPGGLRLVRDRAGLRLGPVPDASGADRATPMLSSGATVGFPPRGVH
jgi:tRNA(Ile)-lysidine synthase